MHSPSTAAAAAARTNEPIAIGSEAHKRLFCALMLDTHDPYDPDRIAWPALDEAARARLVALPFWDDAVTTEDAAARVAARDRKLPDRHRDQAKGDEAEERGGRPRPRHPRQVHRCFLPALRAA